MTTGRPSIALASVFVLALAILVFVGVVSYRTTGRLVEQSNSVEHTFQVLSNIGALWAQISDADTSARGYVLTGDEQFLEPYNASLDEISQGLATLRKLTADNPRQQRRLDVLEPLIARRLAIIKKRINLRKTNGLAVVSDAIRGGGGQTILLEFRHVLRDMEAEENDLLKVREASARSAANAATVTALVGTGLSMSLLLGVFFLLNREVRQREQAEEMLHLTHASLEQRAAQLEAANKELEAFTYSVSHDLRSPLRHVDGFSKILLEEFKSQLDPTAQRYLDRIRAGTQQMGQLVDDLLNLARVSRRELTLQVSGLNSIVQEVLCDLKPEMENRQIDWQISNLPFVECDAALMKQVFVNLLSNAVKFTRLRERAVIQLGTIAENGHAAVFVRDNGVGFNMKYADKLFGVFQRLHRAEDFEGTGVGLATVQRIIHKHGGRVWAEGELDKGATFYFSLASSENTAPKTSVHQGGDR